MSKTQANLLLLVAAALWGSGNVAQKTVLVHLDPFSAVGMRCLIGSVPILPLLWFERGMRADAGYFCSAVRVAILFTCALLVQQTAFLSASVAHASFLVNAAVVIAPFLAWFALGERPTGQVWMAMGLTLAGAWMLFGGVRGFGWGEAVAVFSALLYAIWMIELSRHMQTFGLPVRTACMQFLTAATAALPIGGLWGALSPAAAIAAAPELLVLGIGSTALAFGIQTLAQRYTPVAHAAVIVSAEGVFGAIGAVVFLGERISVVSGVGAGIMLCAIVHLALGERNGPPSVINA